MVKELEKVGPLRRGETLAEQVFLELKELLMSGKLVPDQRLSLRNVASTLSVSMMPVRDAVTRLCADGSLSVHPNRAISVPVMTRAKLRELTNIRIVVEGYAAEEAAANHTAEELESIRAMDRVFRAATKDSGADVSAALAANKEFHFQIYKAARMPSLVAIIEGLWLKVGPVINLDLRAGERLSRSGAEGYHARIVEALERRNKAAAREALVADITSSSNYIMNVLTE